MWLLLTTAYGLVNAKAKWKVQSDNLLTDIGFIHACHMLQLFLMFLNGRIAAIAAKIVDDILMAGPRTISDQMNQQIDARYTPITVTKTPGIIRFFGLTIEQYDDRTSQVTQTKSSTRLLVTLLLLCDADTSMRRSKQSSRIRLRR